MSERATGSETTHGTIHRHTSHQDQPSAGQLISAVLGTTYVVVGLLGFLVTGSSDFTGHDPAHNIAGITVNPLHNVAHLLVGGLGVAAYARPTFARAYGALLLVAYGGLFVWGLLVAGEPNAMNLDTGANVLHGATALLGLLIALLPARHEERADSAQGAR
ncbi:DUF4383 domain-containing protein [Kineococcus sp. SYSU DK003]|uniref:DUF4383 domain-containing protein n=1 Tax=Kineococcus sp. SYSU DK003 TaxID=3383124 RepID=UPI003D7CEDBD